MKKRLLILMTVTGMIILLGGLLTYGLGVHEIIPVPRPDLIVVGTSLIGILLIVSGVCDLFVKKTKEMEIEENDERNISLSNAAMASGFKVMNVTIAVSIFALIFTGYMTVVPCFTIIGAYAIGQIVFIVRLWYLHKTMLYDIYKTANSTEKQITQAKKLLLMGNEKFWDVLKQIYKKCGAWNENYESLLDELKDSKRTVCYRSILISENEKKRLLEDVMENPYDLFYYGKYLVKDYPEQVYELCYKEISESCALAKDRREYKKITKNIAQLIKWKGNDTAKSLIEELMQRYPRKPALLDELEKVEKKL